MAAMIDGAVFYRAHRGRFLVTAAFLVPLTAFVAWLAYEGIFLGHSDVRSAWSTLPIGGLLIWFDCMLVAKVIWPPELEVSLQGIRWANRAMLQWPADYSWQDIDAPEQSSGADGVPLLQIVVKATGRKLRLPPSHFGATYDEMAAVILAARAGLLISPVEWRTQHPQPRFRHWLIDWGLPVSLGVIVAIAIGWFRL